MDLGQLKAEGQNLFGLFFKVSELLHADDGLAVAVNSCV